MGEALNSCPPSAAPAPLFGFPTTVVTSSRQLSTFLVSKSKGRPTLRRNSPGHRRRPSFVEAATRRSHATGEPPLPLPWPFGVKWDARSCRAAAPSTREALCELKLAGWPSLASHRLRHALCHARAPRACAEPRCSGRAPWPHVVGWPNCFGPRQAMPP
jgi:hypothetical protein